MTFKELINKINSRVYKKSSLRLDAKKLTDKRIIILAKAIKNNGYITELDVSDNEITGLGAKALYNINLTKLIINNNPIGDEGIINIAKSKTITELHIENCDFTEFGAHALFDSNVMQYVNMSFNFIKKEGFKSLPYNNTLKVFILIQGCIDDDCAQLIAQAQVLEKVIIPTNSVGPRGAAFLSLNNTICELKLSQNIYLDIGVNFFGVNEFLSRLDLVNCNLKSATISFLSKNTTLTYLDLSFNKLDDECAPLLAQMPSLEILLLDNNKITFEGKQILESLSFKMLGLVGNPIHRKNIKKQTEPQIESDISNIPNEVLSTQIEGSSESNKTRKKRKRINSTSFMENKKLKTETSTLNSDIVSQFAKLPLFDSHKSRASIDSTAFANGKKSKLVKTPNAHKSGSNNSKSYYCAHM